MNKLKSVKETAPLLNCAEITLRRLIKARKIPYHKIGCRFLFTDENIRQYLESTKVEPICNMTNSKLLNDNTVNI